MKKTYMQPATLLTTVAVEKMICASSTTPQVGVDPTATPVDAESVDSRSSSWFDDEE